MPDRYPKRLIEVDLPIRRISAHARREKSIRHGHISTLPFSGVWPAHCPTATEEKRCVDGKLKIDSPRSPVVLREDPPENGKD